MQTGMTKAPGGHTEGFHKDQINDPNSTSRVPESKLDQAHFERDLNGLYIVVAQIRSQSPEPRFRRFYYANLPAAQRRYQRALSEGKTAYLLLAQLNILPGGLHRLDLNGGDAV